MTASDLSAGVTDGVQDLLDNNNEASTPQWGDDVPRGGRAVLSRIIKDGANVPLFLGQTLINSLRDVGYNHTTSDAIADARSTSPGQVRTRICRVRDRLRKTLKR
jgi:hypothetical protein